MTKELPVPDGTESWEDLIKPKNTNTTNNSNNENSSTTTTGSNTHTEIDSSGSTITKPSTNISTNTSTVIAEKKTKYVATKVQRAYWIDKKILKTFEKEYPKEDYDRSQIITNLIRKFLEENGKI